MLTAPKATVQYKVECYNRSDSFPIKLNSVHKHNRCLMVCISLVLTDILHTSYTYT